jgi:hypothetical protein
VPLRSSHRRAVTAGLAIGFGLGLAPAALAQQEPDYGKLAPVLSGNIPTAVPHFPFSALPRETRPMFDTFMWQNFIAVMWPSRPEDHGEPYHPDDPQIWAQGYVNGRQPAFMGWKTADDLYPGNGHAPPDWEDTSAFNPCTNINNTKLPLLVRTSKFGTIADEVDQAFAGPLIDQTGLLTRYEVRVNRAEYEYVRNNQYYNKASWPQPPKPPISFPASTPYQLGAMEVKIAWRDLSKVDPKFHNRFYTVKALAVEAGTCTSKDFPISGCKCQEITVGMVGFHLTQKTEQFPQWVWGTFEQVDNLGEDPSMPAGMTPSYYNGAKANPADHPGYSYEPTNGATAEKLTAAKSANGDGAGLQPVNVTRLSAIPSTPATLPTDQLNTTYRKLLTGTVWANYWLIGSQWSTLPGWPAPNPVQATYPNAPPQDFGCEDGTPPMVGGLPFPMCQLANITMETYHQYDSCQNCHQGAQRAGADFSWSLFQRAYSPSATATSRLTVKHRRPRAATPSDSAPPPPR